MLLWHSVSYIEILNGFGDVELVHGGDDDGGRGEEEQKEKEDDVDDEAADPPDHAAQREVLPAERGETEQEHEWERREVEQERERERRETRTREEGDKNDRVKQGHDNNIKAAIRMSLQFIRTVEGCWRSLWT